MVVHSDVWSHSGIPWLDIDGLLLYWLYFRVTCAYLLHNKNNVSTSFKSFHKMIQNQFKMNIELFRSDNRWNIWIKFSKVSRWEWNCGSKNLHYCPSPKWKGWEKNSFLSSLLMFQNTFGSRQYRIPYQLNAFQNSEFWHPYLLSSK